MAAPASSPFDNADFFASVPQQVVSTPVVDPRDLQIAELMKLLAQAKSQSGGQSVASVAPQKQVVNGIFIKTNEKIILPPKGKAITGKYRFLVAVAQHGFQFNGNYDKVTLDQMKTFFIVNYPATFTEAELDSFTKNDSKASAVEAKEQTLKKETRITRDDFAEIAKHFGETHTGKYCVYQAGLALVKKVGADQLRPFFMAKRLDLDLIIKGWKSH